MATYEVEVGGQEEVTAYEDHDACYQVDAESEGEAMDQARDLFEEEYGNHVGIDYVDAFEVEE